MMSIYVSIVFILYIVQTGELVRVMAGEDLSSTDLHLAAGDTLLVGQVAEMTQVDPHDTLATTRVHNRKLQVSIKPICYILLSR